MKGTSSGSGVRGEAGGESLISSAGATLLQTAVANGLAAGLSRALARGAFGSRSGQDGAGPSGGHRAGRGCLADVAVLRAQPEVFGAVASNPTISRLVDTLAGDVAAAIRAAAAPGCGRTTAR